MGTLTFHKSLGPDQVVLGLWSGYTGHSDKDKSVSINLLASSEGATIQAWSAGCFSGLLWILHEWQLFCHNTGCGLATKMTVVCVLMETLPWILSLWLYQDLFIKIKMSWLTWTPLSASGVMFVGESLPQPVLHEQPDSLYIFPKSWCGVSEHCPSPEQPGSWGCLSKRDWLQPNKSPSQTGKLSLSSAGDTKVNPSTAHSSGHLISHCWNLKHRETFW